MKMSRSYYESRAERDAKLYCGIRPTQIYQWLLLVGVIWPGHFAHRSESRDALVVNFHRRYNVSKVAILGGNGYLPSIVPDFTLPQVIDNRVRNMDVRYPGDRTQPFQHHRRPYLSRGEQSQRTATQPPVPAKTPPGMPTANRIDVEEMSCRNAGDELFFRVTVKAPRISNPPIVDNAKSEGCRTITVKDTYRINIGKDEFWNCGIVDCSIDGNRSYCLDLRFPVINGLRLKDDYRITLRCKTQERIAHRTKRINVKTLETKARNVPNVINGGFRNSLDMDVGLFRRTYGSEAIFDTRIQPGGTVVLGEEILLRVLVNGNDGWRHSRIGQVTVHYVEKKERQNVVSSLWILDKDGCLNPDVREICPREQYMASPLESYLIFQAFMFEGMQETDEMFLTVKATACLEAADCILDCPAGHVRRGRSIRDRNSTVEWQDDIALRVLLPRYEPRVSRNYYLAFLSSTIVLFAVVALLWFVKASLRQRMVRGLE